MEIASEFAKSDYFHGNLQERQIKTLKDFSLNQNISKQMSHSEIQNDTAMK